MQTKTIIALGVLALGVVFAGPTFGQEPRACIHSQTGCSDAPYPVTESATKPSGRRLYNMVPPRVVDHGMPQQSMVQPCIHVQTYCM